jgi:hypothetical protein
MKHACLVALVLVFKSAAFAAPERAITQKLGIVTNESSNSNSGHDYGTTLSAEEKHALIEYLKTL